MFPQGYHGVVLQLVECVAGVDSRDLQRDVITDVMTAAAAVGDRRGAGGGGSVGGRSAVPWLLGFLGGSRAHGAEAEDASGRFGSHKGVGTGVLGLVEFVWSDVAWRKKAWHGIVYVCVWTRTCALAWTTCGAGFFVRHSC